MFVDAEYWRCGGQLVFALCDPMLLRPTTLEWGLFNVGYKAFFNTWVELPACLHPLNEGRAAVSDRLDSSVDPEIDGSPHFYLSPAPPPLSIPTDQGRRTGSSHSYVIPMVYRARAARQKLNVPITKLISFLHSFKLP